jgi:hypothetical protein
MFPGNQKQVGRYAYSSRVDNYPFKDEEALSLVKEPTIKYDTHIEYLCVNSSDRNTTAYPKVNSYRINFPDIFRNIHSIEVVSCSIANQNTPLANPYLILKVDGIDHLNFSNNNINKGFALLYLKPTTGAHAQAELGVLQRNVRFFETPMASLDSVSIQILKPDGTLFDFGESNGDTTVAYSNSFVFKIVIGRKSRCDLHNRSVY